jgi:hypothetical protein
MVYTQLTENQTVLDMMEGNWKFGRLWELYNQTKTWFEERLEINRTRCDAQKLKVLAGDVEGLKGELEKWYNFTLKLGDFEYEDQELQIYTPAP